jgi:integrase
MPRPRKARNSGLPPHVYCAKGRYFLRLPGGTEVRLAPASASKREVWEAYLQVPAQPSAATAALTVATLCEQYQRSPSHAKLAVQTQRDIARALRTVCDRPTGDGRSFGEQLAEHVTRGVIRLYLDSRGVESVTRANREIAYLSSAYSWAAERDLVADNPCRGVRRLQEQSRTRYVTDAEYAAAYRLAGERGRSDMQAMMELAYLCRLRENEILRMLDSPAYISPTQGVLAKRGKGSKTQWIEWSPRLEAAIDLARAAVRKRPTPMLIVSATRGTPVTVSGFRSAWQQLRQAAAQMGAPIDWTFHDLKAKGVSDFDGDRHQASGHKTVRMTAVYDRRIHSVKPTV